MSVADDYGRYYAAPATLRGACWPTKPDKVSEGSIMEWMTELTEGDKPLVTRYYVDHCMYLEINNFNQQVRTKSKFPDPCLHSDSELISDCAQNASTSRSRISESETESETQAQSGPVVRAPRKLASDMQSKTSGRWEEFLDRYPMKVEIDAAAQEFISVVTVANEEQAFACLQRYLASDQVKRGIVMKPANWLRQQNRDGWLAEWPAAVNGNGNHETRAQRLAREMEEEGRV